MRVLLLELEKKGRVLDFDEVVHVLEARLHERRPRQLHAGSAQVWARPVAAPLERRVPSAHFFRASRLPGGGFCN